MKVWWQVSYGSVPRCYSECGTEDGAGIGMSVDDVAVGIRWDMAEAKS